MVNLMPWKKKNNIKVRNGGSLSRHSDDHPMSRLREEFDQLCKAKKITVKSS